MARLGAPIRVLIVDDSAFMRRTIESMYLFLCSGRGRRSRTRSHFTRLSMSDMNSQTFLKSFRAQDRGTKVIMVTTEAEKSRVVEAIKAGVNNYVVKPFTPDQLSEKIQETLKKAG